MKQEQKVSLKIRDTKLIVNTELSVTVVLTINIATKKGHKNEVSRQIELLLLFLLTDLLLTSLEL